MPQTYFDSDLTGEQIKAALHAIDGVVTPSNNGKVLAISDGRIVAKSAGEWGDVPVLEPVTIIENGTTIPPEGVDGFNSVTVNVQGGGGSAVVQPLSITQNGTYNPPSDVDGYAPVTVNVSGGSSNGETASIFRWQNGSSTTCWGIMKKLTGDVIGQNGDNGNASISLVGDLMTVTFHGTRQSIEVAATTAIKLKAYKTGRTLGEATMTEYTMAANDQQSFTTDTLYGGLYLEAESV